MWQQGKLPIPATQLPTGTIIVKQNNAASSGAVAIFARVSSHDQKTDLERQVGHWHPQDESL
jgi:predicted site-specific integrase-resolvase